MLYMVVEHFYDGAAPKIYRRAREKGHLPPAGLEYVASWVARDFKTCYQLMRTEDPTLFMVWMENWKDLGSFIIVPVRTSAEAAEAITAQRPTDRDSLASDVSDQPGG